VVRARVARRLGDLRESKAPGLLIDRLGREEDDGVRQEILVALEVINTEKPQGNSYDAELTTRRMTAEEKEALTSALAQMAREDLPDSLRARTGEWLEVMAEDRTVKARSLVLKADLGGGGGLARRAGVGARQQERQL
jgi:hypothetical protein